MFHITGVPIWKNCKDSGTVSETFPWCPGELPAPHVAIISTMVDVWLRKAWAVRNGRLCHFEGWNRERNQSFMEILGFARVFENPHSKCRGKVSAQGRKPALWGCLNYKTSTQCLIVAMCLKQPEMQSLHQSSGIITLSLDLQLHKITDAEAFWKQESSLQLQCGSWHWGSCHFKARICVLCNHSTIQFLRLWIKIQLLEKKWDVQK